MAEDMKKTVIKPSKGAPAVGPYNHGVRIGDMLFCAGQIPIEPANGDLVQGDIKVQTQRVLENVKAILEECTRVPVTDGHTALLSIGFERTPTPEQAIAALESWQVPEQVRGLPSSPERAIIAQLTAMACESYEVGIPAARGVMMPRTWSAAEVASAIP